MKTTLRSGRKLTDAEVAILEEHRLEADLSYRELAARIGIATSRVHGLLNSPLKIANDRTAFKVRRYLASLTTKKRATA